MLRIITATLLVLCLLSCTDKDTTKPVPALPAKGNLRILTYGLPDFTRQHARQVVARRYGFEFYAVAGCVVSKGLIDSVKEHNDQVYAALGSKHGKNWRDLFKEEVEGVFQQEQQVEDLLRRERYIRAKEQELAQAGNGLYFLIEPTRQAGLFEVKAHGWGEWKGNSEQVVYYKLQVNLHQKQVSLISSQIELL